ncbi:hypothetical protein IWQ61_006946 [Dispira simplex]|nr:hypothetical protein IWQ61_006946 [Dispira simplex]
MNISPSYPTPAPVESRSDLEYSLMDRVTQLQNSIDQMSQMFVSGLDYLHTRAPMVAVNPQFPVTKNNERGEPPDVFEKAMREFATDVVKQNRQIHTLIQALPRVELSESEQLAQFDALTQRNQEAADTLRASIRQAQTMLDHVVFALRLIADDQTQE